MLLKYPILVFLFFTVYALCGQAVFTGPVQIKDLDTTTVNVRVQNIDVEDLSDANQGVCAVRVKLRHDFIGDVKASLISPAGQEVQLLGQAVAQAPGTQFVQWDVQFNACAFPVFPDGAFDERWDNLNPWTGLGAAFVGTYYPFEGCLEDFDAGSAIGEWKLQFIDQSENGTGIINSFEIIFCNSIGLEFAQCDPGDHEVSSVQDTFCQYDGELEDALSYSFIGDTPESDFYSYQYAVFSNDELVQLADIEGVNSLSGSYLICGLSYQTDEAESLENLPLGSTEEEIQEYIDDNNLCVTISSVCQPITLLQAPPLVRDTVVICIGEEFSVGGMSYDESGEYTIRTPMTSCDSISILVLDVVDNPYKITSTIDSLSCMTPGAQLSIESVASDVTVMWSTIDGLLDGNINSVNINALKPGTYTATLVINGCTFTEEFILGSSLDYIFAILESDTLSCSATEAMISLIIEGAVDSIIWSSDFPFTEVVDGILVNTPGTYAVEIFGTEGCNAVRGIEVIADTVAANLIITNAELSCLADSVTIYGTPEEEGLYEYEWFLGAASVGTDSSLLVTEANAYSLVVTAANGCKDTSLVEVLENTTQFDISLVNDTLTCSNPVAELSFESDLDLTMVDILWTSPSGATASTAIYNTTEIDTFKLNLSSDNGCLFDTAFVVLADTLSAEIFVGSTVFNCEEDSIQIQLSGTMPTDNISWEGPFFSSSEEDPWIKEIGEYYLSVTSENGCVVLDTIIATAEPSVPEMSFNFGEINCDADTVNIIPSNTAGFSFLWTDPQGNTFTENNFTARDTGRYIVKFADTANGCFGQRTLMVEENFIDTLESVIIGKINCDVSIITPEIVDTNFIRTASWFDIDNNIVYSSEYIPEFSTEGTFSFDYILDNGCMGSDTITIVREETLPMVSVTTDTISCNEPIAEIRAVIVGPQSDIVWIFPDNSMEDGYVIETDQVGIHTGIATAVGNCMDTIYVEVPGDTIKPEVSLVVDGPLTCSNDEVVIGQTSTDIRNVSWTGPGIIGGDSLSVTVNRVGLYGVSVMGENGCIGEDEITVDSNKVYPIYNIQADTINCINNEAGTSIEPAESDYVISWDNLGLSGFSNNVLLSGVYYFTITTNAQCSNYDSMVILLDTLKPEPSVQVLNEITCLNLSTDVIVENPDSSTDYEWSGPGIEDGTLDSVINLTIGGQYTLLASSSNGCTDVRSVEVIQNNSDPDIELIGDTINCDIGKAFIDVNSDIELIGYLWSGPDMYESTSDRPLVSVAGLYEVTVTGDNGCVSEGAFEIVDVQIFPDIEVDTFYLRCDDDPVIVTASVLSEGAAITWIGPQDLLLTAPELPASIEGEYVAFASNQDGCISSDTFQIIDQPILPVFDFVTDSLFCKGDITLKSTDTEDDVLVTWKSPDDSEKTGIEIFVNEPGDYLLSVLGINGCEDSIIVNVPDGRYYPDYSISKLSELQCNKETVELTLIGLQENREFIYDWSSEDGSVEFVNTNVEVKVTGEGLYHAIVTDVHTGCETRDSFTLVQDEQSFQDVILDIRSPSCEDFVDASIEILEYVGEFPPYTVMLDEQSYGQLSLIQFLEPGNYTMVVTDSIGCNIEKQVIIEEGDYPFVDLPNDTIIQLGDSVFIDPMIRPDTLPVIVEWNIPPPCDPCTTFFLSPDDTYYLEVTVSNEAGCFVTDDMLIRVSEEELQKYPNIFSPDGDGMNDRFYMPYTKGVDAIQYVSVYDWNGVKMYEQTNVSPGDESTGWNGNYEGKPAISGVYLYEAVLLLSDGSFITVVGDLTLIR